MSKLWEGECLDGKTIHVTAEQGLGDEILFASMISDLQRKAFVVVWEADARLLTILRRSYPDAIFVRRGTGWRSADFHCPAGNLGRYLRGSADDFPARRDYLQADARKTAQLWRSIPERINTGISWRSGNPKVGQHKTIPLDQWSPILDIPSDTFVDLQYGDTAAERAGRNIHHVNGLDLTNDIDGLAALIWACEAVVTVSNTVAHLAGALGVPTYVLVPSGLGRFWYWGAGESTPWYPTVRVIRYANGEGEAAIRGVAERLSS